MTPSGNGLALSNFLQRLRRLPNSQTSNSNKSVEQPVEDKKDPTIQQVNPQPADLEKQASNLARQTSRPQAPPPLAPAPLPSEHEDTGEEHDEEIWYPEGGKDAWLVVLGGFCGMVGGFSLFNCVGVFQAYLQENQLRDYSPSTVGWIFSIYAFFVFFGGLQIGPVFDRYGPKWLMTAGSAVMVIMLFTLGECTQYWQFILDFSIFGGIGSSLLFTPSMGAIAHWFEKKRGGATGLAATGGAVGGVIFPLALERLFPEVGWAWSCRILGFIYLGVCSVGVFLTRSRLPPKQGGSVLPDFRIFADGSGALALVTIGTWFLEWALFVPLSYVPEFAAANGLSDGFQILAILNALSFFGRWAPGWASDKLGRFNTMLVTSSACMVLVFAFWLPAGQPLTDGSVTKPLLITFAVFFGFFSGSNISLTPICVGQLCDVHEYGRYYATVYTIVSFGSLTSLPIAGSLISAAGGTYWGLIVFCGLCYVVAFSAFALARVRKVGLDPRAKW